MTTNQNPKKKNNQKIALPTQDLNGHKILRSKSTKRPQIANSESTGGGSKKIGHGQEGRNKALEDVFVPPPLKKTRCTHHQGSLTTRGKYKFQKQRGDLPHTLHGRKNKENRLLPPRPKIRIERTNPKETNIKEVGRHERTESHLLSSIKQPPLRGDFTPTTKKTMGGDQPKKKGESIPTPPPLQ